MDCSCGLVVLLLLLLLVVLLVLLLLFWLWLLLLLVCLCSESACVVHNKHKFFVSCQRCPRLLPPVSRGLSAVLFCYFKVLVVFMHFNLKRCLFIFQSVLLRPCSLCHVSVSVTLVFMSLNYELDLSISLLSVSGSLFAQLPSVFVMKCVVFVSTGIFDKL